MSIWIWWAIISLVNMWHMLIHYEINWTRFRTAYIGLGFGIAVWLHLRPVYARAAERNDSFTRLKDCRSIAVALEANCHTLENKHVQDITKNFTLRATPIVDNLPIIVFYPSVLISFGFIFFKHIVMLLPYHIPHVYICIYMLIYVCM